MHSLLAAKKKDMYISAEVVKASEKEFLCGTKKPIFSSMHRVHFLSEASKETVTFTFIYFIFYVIAFFIYYSFPTNCEALNYWDQQVNPSLTYLDVLSLLFWAAKLSQLSWVSELNYKLWNIMSRKTKSSSQFSTKKISHQVQ